MIDALPPAGWYRAEGDPPDLERYWDGQAWTTQTRSVSAPPPIDPQRSGQFGRGSAAGAARAVSHEIDYEIFGDDLQFVEVELDPGETVIGEAGTMLAMSGGGVRDAHG